MMMTIIGLLARQFRDIHHAREFIEVEHGVILAILAEISSILAEPHILHVEGHKAAVASLYALTESQPRFFRTHY
jgi:hypothetical protein